MLKNIFNMELGSPLSGDLVWKAQEKLAAHLHIRKHVFTPPMIQDPDIHVTYRDMVYTTSINPSPDKALVAISSNKSSIQIHELPTEQSLEGINQGENASGNGQEGRPSTLRLTIVPSLRTPPEVNGIGMSKLNIVDTKWLRRGNGDKIVTTFANQGKCFLYKLETCHENTPCRILDLKQDPYLPTAKKGATCMALLKDTNAPELACITACGKIRLFDIRSKSKPVSTILTHFNEPKMCAFGSYIAAISAENTLQVFDVRVAKSALGSSEQIRSFGTRLNSPYVSSQVLGIGKDPVVWMKQLPGAAPGLIAYSTFMGRLGYVDMHTGKHVSLLSCEKEGVHNLTYIPSPIYHGVCHLTRGEQGRGWILYSPKKLIRGALLTSFNTGVDGGSIKHKAMFQNLQISVIWGMNEQADKFLVGGSLNEVVAFSVDMSKPPVDTTPF